MACFLGESARCQNQLPHRARRDPGQRGGWGHLSPTEHGQGEQEILPQLVAQAQPQMPRLRLLRAQVAVVHPYFHLLGHVVGTETEVKAVVTVCRAQPLCSLRGSGCRRQNSLPGHSWDSGITGRELKVKETQGALNDCSPVSRTPRHTKCQRAKCFYPYYLESSQERQWKVLPRVPW